jgi:hypothetical protein
MKPNKLTEYKSIKDLKINTPYLFYRKINKEVHSILQVISLKRNYTTIIQRT